MVGLYCNSGKLPVRFPLYIGMLALARYLILDMCAIDDWRMMLSITVSILM
ncbi:Protein PsiE [Candidatus Nitrotoga sp. BS]|uniref:phosphate-starvation-inducible PsiE family protein n=1 Tax=Candidatus Nitrotoga sp. BS TaxID=2890408 RepID=UPI001EF2A692|nr:phosphate-starvation-inducible PsiE family protein [Candidatus Nitrotoga sp. BS]CAH1213209.1 Protein PsiE [Candidatus Nitrotoga sp. BS]